MSFSSRAEDVLLLQDQQQTEVSTEKTTFAKRLEYCGIGLAYSLVLVASLVATYKCTLLALDRANADPVKEWHDIYEEEGLPKEGVEWNESIEEAQVLKNLHRTSSIAYGSLILGIPYFTYKSRISQNALEYIKKAFQ